MNNFLQSHRAGYTLLQLYKSCSSTACPIFEYHGLHSIGPTFLSSSWMSWKENTLWEMALLYFTNIRDSVWSSVLMLFENSSSDYDLRGFFSFAKETYFLFLLDLNTRLSISTLNYMTYHWQWKPWRVYYAHCPRKIIL